MSAAAIIIVAGLLAARLWPRGAAWTTSAAALASACAVSVRWSRGPSLLVDAPWFSALGSRFVLTLDALSGPLSVFIAGVAVPVLAFTHVYMPTRLREHGVAPTPQERARFCRLLLLFMAVMLVVAAAGDLLVLVLAIELTAVLSFLLIEFERPSSAARSAAMLALTVTVAGSLALLVGVLLLGIETGSLVLSVVADRLTPGPRTSAALACVVAGLLAKSAQVPLHVWLPRAMAAPTPVSAYLHSAALLAAGAIGLLRLRPLLEHAEQLLVLLPYAGFLSVAVGATLALVSDELKAILAYSTIAQYGYVLVFVGLGGSHGAVGGVLFIVAHGLAKCALFLTAGVVSHVTGQHALSEVQGLLRRMPWLAASSAVAAAGLGGAPATLGYFKDELLFAAGRAHGATFAVLATLAAALSVAYIARFWAGIFLGTPRGVAASLPKTERAGLVIPVALLALAGVAGGIATSPLERVFVSAGELVLGRPLSVSLGYHLRPELGMALAAWLLGAVIFMLRGHLQRPLAGATTTLSRVGPARCADVLRSFAQRSSDALCRFEQGDLRHLLAYVLVPAFVLVGLGLVARGPEIPRMGSLSVNDVPLVIALCLTAGAALAATRAREGSLGLVLLLSFVGFFVHLVFALSGAPGVGLVGLLVEITLTLLFLGIFQQTGRELLKTARTGPHVGPWVGLVGGTAAFAVAWTALGSVREEPTMGSENVELAEQLEGHNVLTMVVTEFRGLDAAVELTVLAVALLGAAALSAEARS